MKNELSKWYIDISNIDIWDMGIKKTARL